MFVHSLFTAFILLNFDIRPLLSPWADVIIVIPFLLIGAILLGLTRSDRIKQQWIIPTKSLICGLFIGAFSVLTFGILDLERTLDEFYAPLIRSLRQNRIVALLLKNLPDSFADSEGTGLIFLIFSISLFFYAVFSFFGYRKNKIHLPAKVQIG